MNSVKAWWARKIIDVELILIAMVIIAFGLLLVLVAMIPFSAHATACLIIEVPPQAVIGQPDGDTFHLFTFAPGGMIKIRVQDVDTPERGQPNFDQAKAFTRQWLARGPFQVSTCGAPTFDRIVAVVERNNEILAEALVAAGFSRQQ